MQAGGGNFVYRRVIDVDGIYQIRPRVYPSEAMYAERYRLEDPLGTSKSRFGAVYMPPFDSNDPRYRVGNAWMYEKDVERSIRGFRETIATPRYNPGQFKPEQDYKFVEQPNFVTKDTKAAPYTRSYRNPKMRVVGKEPPNATWGVLKWENDNIITEEVRELRARYGFTWRGISRSAEDRKIGIAGTEMIVVDLKTNEILALRREFGFTLPAPKNPQWDVAISCPLNQVSSYGLHLLMREAIRPSTKLRYEE
jgi:hypothetical protein